MCVCKNPRGAAAVGVSSLINGSREAAGGDPLVRQDDSINTSSGLQTNNTKSGGVSRGGVVTPIPPNMTRGRPAAARIRKLNVWWLHLLAKWGNYNCHTMLKKEI